MTICSYKDYLLIEKCIEKLGKIHQYGLNILLMHFMQFICMKLNSPALKKYFFFSKLHFKGIKNATLPLAYRLGTVLIVCSDKLIRIQVFKKKYPNYHIFNLFVVFIINCLYIYLKKNKINFTFKLF